MKQQLAYLVEAELKLLIHISPVSAHGGEAQAQTPTVLDLLARRHLHLENCVKELSSNLGDIKLQVQYLAQ